MVEQIVVGAGVLPSAADDLRSTVLGLRRSVDDLDAFLRALSAQWTGGAAAGFGRSSSSWSDASGSLRRDLDRLSRLLEVAEGNYGEATRAGVRAWGAGSIAGPGAVVAMSAGLAQAAGAVSVSVPALVNGARTVADAAATLAGAARALELPPGIAGDDEALAGWRARYDGLAARAVAAVRASVVVLAGVGRGIGETADAYLRADQHSTPGAPAPGGAPPAPPPADAGTAAPPPSTGPGLLGPVPDVVAEFYPDVDVAALAHAADGWRRLAQGATRATVDADQAMSRVLAANSGAVFEAMRRSWASVHVPCGTGTVLDLATVGPTQLAHHLDGFADVVRRTQDEIVGAAMHTTPEGGSEEWWAVIQGAKVGLGFLGPAGRIGNELVNAYEVGLRVGLARKDYLEAVAGLTSLFDGSLEARLDDAVAGVRRVEDVAATFTGTSTSPTWLPPLTIDRKQIEKKYDSHARDFGIDLPRGRAGFDELQRQIEAVYASPTTRRVQIQYRGTPVIVNYDVETSRAVLQNPDGSFLSGWTLSEGQLFNVMFRYSLGG